MAGDRHSAETIMEFTLTGEKGGVASKPCLLTFQTAVEFRLSQQIRHFAKRYASRKSQILSPAGY